MVFVLFFFYYNFSTTVTSKKKEKKILSFQILKLQMLESLFTIRELMSLVA